MSLMDWIKNLGKPTETSVAVPLVKKDTQDDAKERQREIREIQITLDLLQEEAEMIYRR